MTNSEINEQIENLDENYIEPIREIIKDTIEDYTNTLKMVSERVEEIKKDWTNRLEPLSEKIRGNKEIINNVTQQIKQMNIPKINTDEINYIDMNEFKKEIINRINEYKEDK